MLKVDIDSFFHRTIEVPVNSFDRQAAFVPIDRDCFIFQSPIYNQGLAAHEPTAGKDYFHYAPDLTDLPSCLRVISEAAHQVEKYYFVGVPSHLLRLSRNLSVDATQYVVSLALSDSAVLSSICSRMFRKIARHTHRLDLDQVFRCAFPTREILAAALHTKSLEAKDLNCLFCDLLTNSTTRRLAKAKVKSLLPLCLSSPNGGCYAAVLGLCGLRAPPPMPTDVPAPDSRYFSLLKSFMVFCQSRDDRWQLLDHLRPPTADSVRSLLLFVLHVTKTTRSPQNDTKIDYSAINWLCFGLSKSPDKAAIEQCLIRAIRTIARDVIATYPMSLFRLLHRLLTSSVFQNMDLLLPFLQSLQPARYPTFAQFERRRSESQFTDQRARVNLQIGHSKLHVTYQSERGNSEIGRRSRGRMRSFGKSR
jgi:hypothetical protein